MVRHLQEELGLAADGGLDERVAVRGLLGDRLAEGKGVAAGLGRREVEVVGGDGGCAG